ncbi:MAG: mycothiol synthase [Pseudonocardiales bacterium]|jgi:mycothiol synthase|nr:mycothiol synthase [Pseudonocardiales bacterium]
MPLTVTTETTLPAEQQSAVRSLADEAEARDGAPPLSDQALAQLSVGAGVRHLIARGEDGRLRGYAQIAGRSLELAGDAESAAALLDAAQDSAAELLVWSHGSRTPVAAALDGRGYRRTRVLHQLRRPLEAPAAEEPLGAGITIRTFVPGQDEQAWLRLNAAAFADHAEQGGWRLEDLAAREREPWFDPPGFLLAERDGRLVGFHWTKVHPDGMGEVYVLGVDPAAQGMRLGAVLLQRGLAYLAGRGAREVLLYVDDSNAAAMRLYERAGFHRHDVDVQWSL